MIQVCIPTVLVAVADDVGLQVLLGVEAHSLGLVHLLYLKLTGIRQIKWRSSYEVIEYTVCNLFD